MTTEKIDATDRTPKPTWTEEFIRNLVMAQTKLRPKDVPELIRKALRRPSYKTGQWKKAAVSEGLVRLFATILFRKFRMQRGRLAGKAQQFSGGGYYLTSYKELQPKTSRRTVGDRIRQLKEAGLIETSRFQSDTGHWDYWGIRPNVKRILELLEDKVECIATPEECDGNQVISTVLKDHVPVTNLAVSQEAVNMDDRASVRSTDNRAFFLPHRPTCPVGVDSGAFQPIASPPIRSAQVEEKERLTPGPAAREVNFFSKDERHPTSELTQPDLSDVSQLESRKSGRRKSGVNATTLYLPGMLDQPSSFTIVQILEQQRSILLSDKWVGPVLRVLASGFEDVRAWINESLADPYADESDYAGQVIKHLEHITRLVRNPHEIYGLDLEKAQFTVENMANMWFGPYDTNHDFELLLSNWIPFARHVWAAMNCGHEGNLSIFADDIIYFDELVSDPSFKMDSKNIQSRTVSRSPQDTNLHTVRQLAVALHHLAKFEHCNNLIAALAKAAKHYIYSHPLIYRAFNRHFPNIREVLGFSIEIHDRLLGEACMLLLETKTFPMIKALNQVPDE